MNRLLLAFLALLCFSAQAHAQLSGTDLKPGDSCTPAQEGYVARNASAARDISEITLICDGSVWQSAVSSGSGGGGVVNAPNCQEGEIPAWSAADNGLKCPEDGTPASFDFADQSGVAQGIVVESNIVTITDIDVPTPVSISGDGSPQIRIEGGVWAASGMINNNQTLQSRMTSNATPGIAHTATVTVGPLSDDWSIVGTVSCTTDVNDTKTFTPAAGTEISYTLYGGGGGAGSLPGEDGQTTTGSFIATGDSITIYVGGGGGGGGYRASGGSGGSGWYGGGGGRVNGGGHYYGGGGGGSTAILQNGSVVAYAEGDNGGRGGSNGTGGYGGSNTGGAAGGSGATAGDFLEGGYGRNATGSQGTGSNGGNATANGGGGGGFGGGGGAGMRSGSGGDGGSSGNDGGDTSYGQGRIGATFGQGGVADYDGGNGGFARLNYEAGSCF